MAKKKDLPKINVSKNDIETLLDTMRRYLDHPDISSKQGAELKDKDCKKVIEIFDRYHVNRLVLE